MFNEICINEEMLPKYTYIYIYTHTHTYTYIHTCTHTHTHTHTHIYLIFIKTVKPICQSHFYLTSDNFFTGFSQLNSLNLTFD